MTTAECLLNKNRNPSLSKQEIEAELDRQLGIKKVLWLPKVKHNSLTPSWHQKGCSHRHSSCMRRLWFLLCATASFCQGAAWPCRLC